MPEIELLATGEGEYRFQDPERFVPSTVRELEIRRQRVDPGWVVIERVAKS